MSLPLPASQNLHSLGSQDRAQHFKHRLRGPLLSGPLPLVAVLAFVMALTGTGIAVFTSVRQTITTRANENLAAIAMLKVEEIERWLKEHRDDTLNLAHSSTFSVDVMSWLHGGRSDPILTERLQHRMQELITMSQYSSVSLHSAADGAALLTVGLNHPDAERERSLSLKSVIQRQPLFDDLEQDTNSNPARVGLAFFSPVLTPDSAHPVAVLHLVSDPEALLFPIVRKWPSSSPSAETLMVRVEGNTVAYLNPLRHRNAGASPLRLPLDAPELLAAQAARGSLGAIQGVDYRNVRSLGYALRVEGTPWLLLAKIDEQEVYENFNRMALFGAIVTALSLIAGFWWAVEHSRSAARIARLSRLYAAISQTNQAIIHSQSSSAVYRAVCAACVDLADLRLAWIGIVDKARERVVPVIAAGTAQAFLDGLEFSTRADHPQGQDPTGRAVREQQACECTDYQSDPTTRLWQARAAEHGLASSISLPLLKDGSTVGILCVYGATRNFFDAEAMTLLVEMASNISFAIEHFSQEEQRVTLAAEMEKHVSEIADLYQNSPCGYHSLDANGLIIRMNDTELRWLGYERTEVVNKLHAADLMTRASQESFKTSFLDFKSTGEIRNLDLELVRKNGSVLPVSVTASAVNDTVGSYLYSRTTVFDMTDVKRFERERIAHEEHLRDLSRRLVAVQEEERRQLVQTLHDNASPNLAAIQIILNTMQKSLKGEPSPHAIEAAIEDAIALLEDTGLSIREVCSDLRPPLLDYAGLIPALDSYAHQFSQRTGMAVNFNVEGPSSRFSPEVESSLFRITQEALTNCAKHAGAAEVDIDIVVSEGALLLTITDDGNGFSLESLGASGRSPGLGLITMRERTEFIGGRFEIQSRIGMGTRLVVVLQPLQPSPLPLPRRLTFRGAASCDLDASPAQTQAAGGMA